MIKAKKSPTVEICTTLAQTTAQTLGVEIWDVVFEKEGSSWFLRYYIDKQDGVTIADCENFSRAMDKILDEADPIDKSYYLEVSSPGLERKLVKDSHFDRFIDSKVVVKLVRPIDAIREFVGDLKSSAGDNIEIVVGDGVVKEFSKKDIAYVKLFVDFSGGKFDE